MVNFSALMIGLFLLLATTNLMSMVPYVMGPTTHISFTLSLALPVWLTTVLSGATFSPYAYLSHLLPLGAPMILAPFLIIVEVVSSCIRFLTLSLRLAANLTVGHVILNALGTYTIFTMFSSPTNLLMILTLALSIGYMLFEFGVALLQAYIFFLLSSLYSNDHPL
uniref:ATP synthase subunit a n=1 Tax=Phyllochaetopterus sp. AW-2015 TaxID=1750699 RepID=A0A0S2N0G0_9ANNE|nr:ATP synthase F0 subunit 6 [Phyllochaetopterus sp. AW-2015]